MNLINKLLIATIIFVNQFVFSNTSLNETLYKLNTLLNRNSNSIIYPISKLPIDIYESHEKLPQNFIFSNGLAYSMSFTSSGGDSCTEQFVFRVFDLNYKDIRITTNDILSASGTIGFGFLPNRKVKRYKITGGLGPAKKMYVNFNFYKSKDISKLKVLLINLIQFHQED